MRLVAVGLGTILMTDARYQSTSTRADMIELLPTSAPDDPRSGRRSG